MKHCPLNTSLKLVSRYSLRHTGRTAWAHYDLPPSTHWIVPKSWLSAGKGELLILTPCRPSAPKQTPIYSFRGFRQAQNWASNPCTGRAMVIVVTGPGQHGCLRVLRRLLDKTGGCGLDWVEKRENDKVEKVTGRPPRSFDLFAQENRSAWVPQGRWSSAVVQ